MSSKFKNKLYNWFILIAEPRAVRVMQFAIYALLEIAGISIITSAPDSFTRVLPVFHICVLGGFISFGAFLGLIAVLPGIWWLERAGLVALATGMMIYITIIIALGTSPMGLVVSLVFTLTFAQRWTEIRRYQVAPREE